MILGTRDTEMKRRNKGSLIKLTFYWGKRDDKLYKLYTNNCYKEK